MARVAAQTQDCYQPESTSAARQLILSGDEGSEITDAKPPFGAPTALQGFVVSRRTGRYASERTDVLRLRSLLPLGRVELDLLVLIQRPVAAARDRREVDEHVRRPV